MQRSRWSFDLMLACLVILTATFFVLTIYSILQANAAVLPDIFSRYLFFKILDTSSAATLFVTLLGALLVRHQFAVGLLPRIIYRSTNAVRQEAKGSAQTFETWRVEVRNSGLGAAIISGSHYALELPDSKTDHYEGVHKDTVQELAKIGLVRGSDYWMENITTGFALSPKDDCLVFEIKAEHLAKIKRLDMRLYFKSQLGGKYSQKVAFIPQRSVKAE